MSSARNSEARIAYQVIGDGPFDLIAVPGFVANVEYLWETRVEPPDPRRGVRHEPGKGPGREVAT